MGLLQHLLLTICVAVCLNLTIAFPMWYGHPIFMATYRKNGDWWGNHYGNNGVFNGWGMHRRAALDGSGSYGMLD